jgi:hypothetical protein
MPSHAAQVLSMLQSILLSLWQSINHDNVLYILNYYINILIKYNVNISILIHFTPQVIYISQTLPDLKTEVIFYFTPQVINISQ